MLEIKTIPIDGFEHVIEAKNRETGLHAFFAIHNTSLGPALGGTRIYPYKNPEDALNDVLRLAKGMTYKSAIVETGLGGGKSVIIANPKSEKSEDLLLSFGEALNTLNGQYIVAEDVGSTTEDMTIIHKASKYVSALPTELSSGDPSRFTAFGIYRGLQAVAEKLWGNSSLRGRTISIQGVGQVGSRLARILFWEGADLIVSDIDHTKAHAIALETGAKEIAQKDYFSTPCDILSPCALGGILNHTTIPLLKCKAIAGAANNQLLTDKDGEALMKRGILYAPDYVINSGGIINAAAEFEPGGYDPKKSRDRVHKIYDSLLDIFNRADAERLPTNLVANEIAEYKIKEGIGKRKSPIVFK